jgi:hypothetical protein
MSHDVRRWAHRDDRRHRSNSVAVGAIADIGRRSAAAVSDAIDPGRTSPAVRCCNAAEAVSREYAQSFSADTGARSIRFTTVSPTRWSGLVRGDFRINVARAAEKRCDYRRVPGRGRYGIATRSCSQAPNRNARLPGRNEMVLRDPPQHQQANRGIPGTIFTGHHGCRYEDTKVCGCN